MDTDLHLDPSTALLVVDVQHDFADPHGGLYVPDGEAIVPGINALVAAARPAGSTVVATQDWHPPSTPHFSADGGVWPVHCVRDTWGAALHRDLSRDADLILRKGTGGEDGYSAFGVADPTTGATTPTGLAAYLSARGISRVVVVGLALDVCVKATALDAVGAGLETTVRADLCRAVDLSPGDGDAAVAAMQEAGVSVRGLV
ncbi:MAG: isochorismatase family protein [Actinomycetota bacterium]